MSLKRKSPRPFSDSSILRMGVQVLYGIKQLHEIGSVHRDVKPGNVMIGMSGRERRSFFLIDYGNGKRRGEEEGPGMARSFVMRRPETGAISMRKPRRTVLLRGTLRYCSLTVHRRCEQVEGRPSLN